MNNILSIIQQVFSGQILGGEMHPMALLHKVYEKAKSMNSTVIYGGLNLKMSVLANEYVAETQPTIEKIPNLLSAILEKCQHTNSESALDITLKFLAALKSVHPKWGGFPERISTDEPSDIINPVHRTILAPDSEAKYRVVVQTTQQIPLLTRLLAKAQDEVYLGAQVESSWERYHRLRQQSLREIPRGESFRKFLEAIHIFREIRENIIKNDLFSVAESPRGNDPRVHRTKMTIRQNAHSPRCILSRLESAKASVIEKDTEWISPPPSGVEITEGEPWFFPQTMLTLYSSYEPEVFASEELMEFRETFFENGLPKSAIDHLMDHILLSGYTYNSLMERISTIYRTDLRKFECLATAKSPDYNQCFDAVAYLAKNKAYGKEYAFFKRNINTHMEESFRLMNYIAMTHEIPRIVRTLSLLLQEVKTSRALVTQQTKLEDALFQS